MSGSSVVPVVRLIVPDHEGRVLLLQRAPGTASAGAWCLPGGKVDYGQTALAAVHAELLEETALRCEEARFLFYQDSLPEDSGGMHCINLCFECRATGDVSLNAESKDWVRIGAGELGDYDVAFRGDDALKRFWHLRR